MHIIRLLLISCLYLYAFSSYAQTGEALYLENCSICHGIDGNGGVGIPLSLDDFQQQVPDEYLIRSIIHGRPGRIMPAFESLKHEQIKDIVKHIRSWSKQTPPDWDNTVIKGDIQLGAKLFAQHCQSCHGEQGRGGKGTGVAFSRKKDSPITAPALNNPGFLASANDQMIKTIIMQGRQSTPMQSASSLGLNEQDVNHIVAYIRHFETQTKPSTNHEVESPVLIYDSNYSFEQTIENVKNAAIGMNFRIIRKQPLDQGLAKQGNESQQHSIIYFCNFQFLYEALAIDPRVGLFLPCRITVTEHKGKVQVMSINPNRLSHLFNNNELDQACEEMHELYTSILEEATL